MNNQKETDWINKEKRELFCKYVNSTIMTDIKQAEQIEIILNKAQQVVDTAFELYPDRGELDNEERPI